MLEANKLGEKIFADVNNRLDKAGLMMHGGTIVDASLIAAPKSTKNPLLIKRIGIVLHDIRICQDFIQSIVIVHIHFSQNQTACLNHLFIFSIINLRNPDFASRPGKITWTFSGIPP